MSTTFHVLALLTYPLLWVASLLFSLKKSPFLFLTALSFLAVLCAPGAVIAATADEGEMQVKALIQALKSDDQVVRSRAEAKILNDVLPMQYHDILQKALNDPDPNIKTRVAIAMARMGDYSVFPALLEEKQNKRHKDTAITRALNQLLPDDRPWLQCTISGKMEKVRFIIRSSPTREIGTLEYQKTGVAVTQSCKLSLERMDACSRCRGMPQIDFDLRSSSCKKSQDPFFMNLRETIVLRINPRETTVKVLWHNERSDEACKVEAMNLFGIIAPLSGLGVNRGGWP